MGKWVKCGVIAVAAIILGNAAYVTVPSYLAKRHDPRNSKVTMLAHLRWGVDPSTVVIDLLDVDYTAASVDVTRTFFDIAQALKGRTFSTAQLAFRGSARFQMDGRYFKQIGEERDWQNPVYTIRTMPEHLQPLDGGPAFGKWTGGWLGVMNKQLEDSNELHRRWYINNL
jgi:hypothetical protein